MANNPSSNSSPTRQPGCLNLAILAGILVWIALVSYIRISTTNALSLVPIPDTRLPSLGLAAGQAVLLLLPLVPLAIFWPYPRSRAIFQTWAWAAGFVLVNLPVLLTPATAAQLQAVLHILLSLLYSALIAAAARWRLGRSPEAVPAGMEDPGRPRLALLLALLIAALVLYPWLAWGALGSLLDTLLQIAAALSIGLAAGLLLEYFLFRPLHGEPAGAWADFFTGGLGAAAALVLIASGTGFSLGGMQLLLMIVLPALGWALAVIRHMRGGPSSRRAWLPLTLLVGLAAAGPMALVDPDELFLIISLSPGEILEWASRASLVSALIGLGAGVVLFFFSFLIARGGAEREAGRTPGWAWPAVLVLTLAAWLGGIALYFTAGQPGLYGERMFVILREQADLSAAPGMADYLERREFVYTTLVEQADRTQAELRQTLDRLNISYTPYYLVNAIEVEGNPLLRVWLETRPEVDRVLDSPRMRPLPEDPPLQTGQARAPSEPQWNLTIIGADRVWNELQITGEGVVVGQSDSGAEAGHTELAGSYRGQGGDHDYNWYDPWYRTPAPTDTGGHGTHTLGSVLGQRTGIAPGATWFACANLRRNLGNPALYLDCMQFMLAPFPQEGDPFTGGDPSLGAHVINNSWGCPDIEGCDPNSLLVGVRALRLAGIFFEASAGNDGPTCASLDDPPAIYAESFSTGAIDRSGNLAIFSSRGPVTVDGSDRIKPDLVAPGVDVLSAYPGNTYITNSGTSMAGPHVTGVVALMWSANPALIGDIERTEEILQESASPYTGELPECPGANEVPSTAVGYGILDAYTAVQMAIQEGR